VHKWKVDLDGVQYLFISFIQYDLSF